MVKWILIALVFASACQSIKKHEPVLMPLQIVDYHYNITNENIARKDSLSNQYKIQILEQLQRIGDSTLIKKTLESMVMAENAFLQLYSYEEQLLAALVEFDSKQVYSDYEKTRILANPKDSISGKEVLLKNNEKGQCKADSLQKLINDTGILLNDELSKYPIKIETSGYYPIYLSASNSVNRSGSTPIAWKNKLFDNTILGIQVALMRKLQHDAINAYHSYLLAIYYQLKYQE